MVNSAERRINSRWLKEVKVISQVQVLSPVILETWETKLGSSAVHGQSWQKRKFARPHLSWVREAGHSGGCLSSQLSQEA
jgi:hypothetical protein